MQIDNKLLLPNLKRTLFEYICNLQTKKYSSLYKIENFDDFSFLISNKEE